MPKSALFFFAASPLSRAYGTKMLFKKTSCSEYIRRIAESTNALENEKHWGSDFSLFSQKIENKLNNVEIA